MAEKVHLIISEFDRENNTKGGKESEKKRSEVEDCKSAEFTEKANPKEKD